MNAVQRSGKFARFLFALLLSASTVAQAGDQRIGLVLGGGGARGAAHIGVLKVLERERIPVHAIAGTSIGAIIGGLYAAGYSADEIEQVFSSIDWIDVFDDDSARVDVPMRQKETDLGVLANLEVGLSSGHLTLPETLVRGQKLGLMLRRLFLGRGNLDSFDDLPVPFRCVATDIGTVQPVVFDSGDLALAIRASMAVPGAFAPVHHDSKVLIDGGVVDNVPIDVMRRMGVDRLIAVDVGQPLAPASDVDTTLEILLQMVGGMMRDRTQERLRSLSPDDLLLKPELIDVTTMSFPSAVRGIGSGERAAVAALDRLREFSVSEAEYSEWRAQRRPLTQEPEIAFVHVDSAQTQTSEFVQDRITARAGTRLDTKALDHDIAGAFGRGTFESISYRLTTDERGLTGLSVTPVDSALGRTVFRAGLQISDDFAGSDHYQLNMESRVTGLSSKGAEWRTFLGLGRVSMLATDLYFPFAERGNWFIAPGASYTALDQPFFVADSAAAEYRVESWEGTLRLGRDFDDRFRMSVAALRGQDHAERLVGDPSLPLTDLADLGGVSVTALWDSLDNVRFPRHGLRAEISFTSYDERFASDSEGGLWRVTLDKAFSSGRNTVLIGARASLSKDEIDAFQTQSSLGGLTFLSGLGERELLDDQMLLLRSIYYRRLSHRGLFFDLPIYLAGSLEGGNVWPTYDEVSLDDLIGAGSLFLGIDLPLGPLQLGYGRTFDGRGSFYLTFGSLVLPRYR